MCSQTRADLGARPPRATSAWPRPDVGLISAGSWQIDVFSFAILAWELLRRKRAYDDMYLSTEQVVSNVCRGLRPTVPARWPAGIKKLLADCWAADPILRPKFSQVAEALAELSSLAERDDDEVCRDRAEIALSWPSAPHRACKLPACALC